MQRFCPLGVLVHRKWHDANAKGQGAQNGGIGKALAHLDSSNLEMPRNENDQKLKDKHTGSQEYGLRQVGTCKEQGRKATGQTQKGSNKGPQQTLYNIFNDRGGLSRAPTFHLEI